MQQATRRVVLLGACQRSKPEQRQRDVCAGGMRPATVMSVVNECVLLPVWTCREGGPAAVRGRVFVYLRVERIC